MVSRIGTFASSFPSGPVITLTGGTLIDDGLYWIRRFDANGTLTVSGGTLTGAEIFVVGGGGPGGTGNRIS